MCSVPPSLERARKLTPRRPGRTNQARVTLGAVSSRDVLDQVYSLANLTAFAAAPESFRDALAAELGEATTLAGFESSDASLRGALDAVDSMAIRAMRLRLDHALALEPAVPPVTRNVFATTIVQYAGNVELLGQRIRDVATRGCARDVDAVVRDVVGAARDVLALRDGLRVDVLELARERAKAGVGIADSAARDKRLDEATRGKWSRVRRDLEAVANDPSRIVGAAMPERTAKFDEQIDEPAPAPEPSVADLLELD